MFSVLALSLLLQTQPAPIDCSDADHSAFNFWVGDWIVSPTGLEVDVATSRIGSVANGCAIEETYHQTMNRQGQPLDYRGHSYSAFDAADGRWKQFYVDSNGVVTMFVGGAVDGTIVVVAGSGGSLQRMTVRPIEGGRVRQNGESSTDGGATWTATYDFTYRPATNE